MHVRNAMLIEHDRLLLLGLEKSSYSVQEGTSAQSRKEQLLSLERNNY